MTLSVVAKDERPPAGEDPVTVTPTQAGDQAITRREENVTGLK